MIKASFLSQVQFINGKRRTTILCKVKGQIPQVRKFSTTFSNHLIATDQDPKGPSQNRALCMSSACLFSVEKL